MKVLIVGAGPSGLETLLVFRRAGLDAECVDRQPQVSGVWVPSPDSFCLQTAAHKFAMPGVPFPPGTPKQCGRREVIDYWESIVKNHKLDEYISLETSVIETKRTSDGWEVYFQKVKNTDADDHFDQPVYVKHYDYLIVATGIYGRSELANKPENIPGLGEFPGTVAHNSELPRNWSPEPGQSVAIVGFGATAMGYLREFSNLDPSVKIHHIFRQPRWWIPHRFFGFIPYDVIFFARASLLFISAWFYSSSVQRILHTYLGFLVLLFWKFVEKAVIISSRAPAEFVPEERVIDYLRNAVFLMPRNYFRNIRNSRIATHRGSIEQFTNEGNVILSNGDSVKADMVLLCTGYKRDSQKWLDEDIRSRLRGSEGLYRHILLPGVDNIGFIGFAQSYASPPCAYLAACWLLAQIKGLVEIPNVEGMKKDMAKVARFKKEHVLGESNQNDTTAGRYLAYCDELLVDMGMNPKQGRNTVSWILSQWKPEDFAGVLDEVLGKLSISKKEQ